MDDPEETLRLELPNDLLEKATDAASDLGITVDEFVRDAIAEKLRASSQTRPF
jgi:hypothetical protein